MLPAHLYHGSRDASVEAPQAVRLVGRHGALPGALLKVLVLQSALRLKPGLDDVKRIACRQRIEEDHDVFAAKGSAWRRIEIDRNNRGLIIKHRNFDVPTITSATPAVKPATTLVRERSIAPRSLFPLGLFCGTKSDGGRGVLSPQ